MNFDNVMRLIGRWAGTMRFFPSEPEGARFRNSWRRFQKWPAMKRSCGG